LSSSILLLIIYLLILLNLVPGVKFSFIPLRTYWNGQQKSFVFFDTFIFASILLRAGTPNGDDRVSPAWLSAIGGQLLCAGCGLREH
jgi:ABC-type transport system involved in cytochrome c biogenesis permease subunit